MRAPVIAALVAAALLGARSSSAQSQLNVGDVLVGSSINGKLYRLRPDPSNPGALVPPVPLSVGGADFASPRGIAVDRNGLLVVTDTGPRTVSRVDPSGTGTHAIMVQLSQLISIPRGVAVTSDGRVYVVDPGVAPPGLSPVRGVTYFPSVLRLDLVGGAPAAVQKAGCSSVAAPLLPLPNCGVNPDPDSTLGSGGNFFVPSGIAIKTEAPVLELLVADAGQPLSASCRDPQPPTNSGRCDQSIISVLPDEPFAPGVNDRPFCAAKDAPDPARPGLTLFGNPRGVAIDPADGSVFVTDSGDTTANKPARIFRIPPGGCSATDPLRLEDIVYEGLPLVRPTGIAVAHGVPGVANGMLLVADATADGVFLVDPVARTSTLLSTDKSIDGAWDLQVYTAGTPSPYFVADAGNPRVLEVDPHPPASFTQVTLGGAPGAVSVLDSNVAAWRTLAAEQVAQLVSEAPFPSPAFTVSDDRRLKAPTSAVPEAPLGQTYLATDLGSDSPSVAPAVVRINPAQLPPLNNQTLLSWGGLLVTPVGGAATPDQHLLVLDAGSLDIPPRIVDVDARPGNGGKQTLLFAGTPLTQRSAGCRDPRVPNGTGATCGPIAITIEQPQGTVVVADAGDPTPANPDDRIPPSIVRFAQNSTGVLVPTFTTSGTGLGVPGGIALDVDHSILVTQPASATVVRVDRLSDLVTAVAIPAAAALVTPSGIGVDSDLDFDGVLDAVDNCFDPTGQTDTANPDQKDSDGDGIGDACETDADADGVDDDGDGSGTIGDHACANGVTTNCDDNCPVDANPGQEDTDGDGVGDACDDCPFVADPGQPDTDGDGLADACQDDDDDNDGILDDGDGDGIPGDHPCANGVKTNCDDNCPRVANADQANADTTNGRTAEGDACEDTDGDTVPNKNDNCPFVANGPAQAGTPAGNQTNTDGDATGDACESVALGGDGDTDGDGVKDDDGDGVSDPCPLNVTTNCDDNCPFVANGTGQAGPPLAGAQDVNACADDDGDGIANAFDNCPNDPNPLQTDTDHDGDGDICDTNDDNDNFPDASDNCPLVSNNNQSDTDGDGIGDACDNCPINANPDQKNSDGDLQGDACDTDADNDGIPNVDTDGVSDPCTGGSKTNCDDNCPFVANPDQEDDDDGDKVGSACDNCRTVKNGPDEALLPAGNQKDTDQDGVGDACDDCPTVANKDQRDDDGDGIGNACDADADNDGDGIVNGLDNCVEVANVDQRDTNGDGFGNACDADYDNNGTVGASDFLRLGMAFGAQLGSPNYDPDLDANGDGGIGATEFLLLGRTFGMAPGP